MKGKLLKGFKDWLPQDLIPKNRLLNTIIEVYESYGFVPLETPALEYKATLLGYGEEASKQIYSFVDPENNEVGLRFDLTVPLSRVVSTYKELPKPFKRYQIQPVWRYDKPDPGRFREFTQCDADIVGTDSMDADTEIIAIMNEVLNKLNLKFKIRVNNRKILNGLIRYAGVPENLSYDVFRTIDKLDKQGLENVLLLLGGGREDQSGVFIKGLNLEKAQIAKIEKFLTLPAGSRDEVLSSVGELLEGIPEGEKGIKELEEINNNLNALGIKENVVFDLTLARGLDYYTGPIFEAILEDAPRFGSVMGGGRFDNLIEIFSGEHTPATGASIGVDRLLSAMKFLGKIKERKSVAEVLVTVMVPERKIDYFKVANQLRKAGIKTELYMGTEPSIAKQLKHADSTGIPIAVIIGPEEFERGEVSVKDLRQIEEATKKIKTREEWKKKRPGQVTIKQEELINFIKKLLNKEVNHV